MNPPKLLEKFLHWTLPNELKETVLGDLAEEYLSLAQQTPLKANYWYTRQALSTGLQFLSKTKREFIMFLIGMIVFVGFILMGMIMSGNMAMYVNLASLLVVIPPAVLLTLASSSKLSRSHGVKLLLGENLNLEKTELHAAKQVFTTFGNMNMLMGWIGVVMGAVAMANSITGENVSQVLGPAFSVCVLTLFYALLIKALCYGAEAKIQFKIINLAS